VIGDPDLFEFLMVARKSVLSGNPAALQHVIQACAALKGSVVGRDEREGDLRRILNFGHTLGHAIEAATHYRRFLHGEAVAWGMLAATRLAVEQKMLPPAEAARIAALIVAYGPVPPLEKTPLADLALHLGVDKKVRDGKIHFVLPRHIGEVAIVGGIEAQQALRVLEQVIRNDPFRAEPVLSRPTAESGRVRAGMVAEKKSSRRAMSRRAAKP
jgi:3-dehydroquinate synthase